MASRSTTGRANVLPKLAAATAGPRNSRGTLKTAHTDLPSVHPRPMCTAAAMGSSHTFWSCSALTALPSTVKRRHGRKTAPFSRLMVRAVSASSRFLCRA